MRTPEFFTREQLRGLGLGSGKGAVVNISKKMLVIVVGLMISAGCTQSKTRDSVNSAPVDSEVSDPSSPVATEPSDIIAAPTGEPFVIGVVNTEGAPGIDYPDFTNAFRAAAAYINAELGGFAGRPVELEVCLSTASPESSQRCAQDLASKNVDLVMLGLDLFVDYPTYSAAGIPVIGAVPIFAGDYTADAVYLTAGNLVVQASTANAITNPKYLGLTKVAVIANDAGATISALATLEPALAKGGATVTIFKGGETETDAGYRSLMQQAAATNPEVIVSLYGQSGCVALMRARVELGITAPVFSNTACLGDAVIDVVGDAAAGWYFAGASGGAETDDTKVMRRYVGEVTNVDPSLVDRFGFTSLGWLELLTIWNTAQTIDGELTGSAITDAFRAGTAILWGSDAPLECGSVVQLKSICSFSIPFAKYEVGGATAAFGGENISALESLDY